VTRRTVGLLACLAPSLAGFLNAQARPEAERIPVLAELFTTEGCSSCPPADRVLELVAKEQPAEGVYVVVMSEHVTYFDHLGWKDPFGSSLFTERQKMYAEGFKPAGVFTPQLVIDGATQMVGSDTGQLKRALADAAGKPKPRLTVGASLEGKDTLVASASGPGLEAGAAEGAELLWAVTEDDLIVEVTRGENAKRTLRHYGVVRTLIARTIDAAPADEGMGAVIRLHSSWKRDHLRLVAFVQSTKTRRVLSVGWTRLSPAP
jgi:hypothetical protein